MVAITTTRVMEKGYEALMKSVIDEKNMWNLFAEGIQGVLKRKDNAEALLERAYNKCPAQISFVDGMSVDGLAKVRHDGVRIIELRKGLSTYERLATLIHEWAHHILHFEKDLEGLPISYIELEAESVAFTVMFELGFVNIPSVEYIGYYFNGVPVEVLKMAIATAKERVLVASEIILENIK